jgi:hypothetical protein
LHLAPKRAPFSGKQPRNRCKWQSFQIKIHFANVHMLPHFAPKQTFARIVFLRARGDWRIKSAATVLNFLLKRGHF